MEKEVKEPKIEEPAAQPEIKTEPVQPPATEPLKPDPAEHMIPKSRLDEEIKKKESFEKELKRYQDAEQKRKESEMTELQKAEAKQKEYETKLAELDHEKLVRKVAEEAGLSLSLAKRLKGETEEELKADAEELLKLIPAPATPDPKKPTLQSTNPGTATLTETREQKRARLIGEPIDIWTKGGGINPPG